jgi:hypothetical protein
MLKVNSISATPQLINQSTRWAQKTLQYTLKKGSQLHLLSLNKKRLRAVIVFRGVRRLEIHSL